MRYLLVDDLIKEEKESERGESEVQKMVLWFFLRRRRRRLRQNVVGLVNADHTRENKNSV